MSVSDYTREINNSCRYATDDELDWMAEAGAGTTQESLVVMLGAGPGMLLLGLKDGNPHLRAVVVDRVDPYYTMAHLEGAGYQSNIEYIVGMSSEVGREWSRGKIDLLIVDTDHTEATTREEIEVWLPHVKPGGLIFFHDYDPVGTWFEKQERYPGVKLAVDDLMRTYKKAARVGTAIIYQKMEIPRTK